MEIRLNLIPEYRKEEISRHRRMKAAIRGGFYLAAVFLIFFLVLLGFNSSLKSELSASLLHSDSGSGRSGYEKVQAYDEEFRNMNSYFSRIDRIQETTLSWSDIFMIIGKLIPDDVILYEVYNKDLNLEISGKSGNREALLGFEESLKSDGCFSEVLLPLSNLVDKENIDFQMEVVISPECISGR